MANEDRYKPASFRNIPFFVETQNFTNGQKVSVIEIPGSDTPVIQNHGIEADYIGIEAYILGDDYYPARNRLINALKVKAIGKLIHPYFGEMNVAVISWSVHERASEANLCRFSINFVKKDTGDLQILQEDPILDVFTEREKTLKTLNDDFKEAYVIVKKPFSVINSTKETLSVGITAIQNARTLYETVPQLQYEMNIMRANAKTAIFDGLKLNEDLFNILTFGTFLNGDLTANENTALPLYENYLNLVDFKTPEPVISQSDPAKVIADFIAETAIVIAASMSPLIEYKSFEQARETRDFLFKKIDSILQNPETSSQLYIDLRSLRSVVAADLDERSINLSRTTIITRPETFSAVVLSYQLYGTPDREDEIIDRNNIQNPCMIKANYPIEVLQNE